jgi:hypothetical protein
MAENLRGTRHLRPLLRIWGEEGPYRLKVGAILGRPPYSPLKRCWPGGMASPMASVTPLRYPMRYATAQTAPAQTEMKSQIRRACIVHATGLAKTVSTITYWRRREPATIRPANRAEGSGTNRTRRLGRPARSQAFLLGLGAAGTETVAGATEPARVGTITRISASVGDEQAVCVATIEKS